MPELTKTQREGVESALLVCRRIWRQFGEAFENDEPIEGADLVDVLVELVADIRAGAAVSLPRRNTARRESTTGQEGVCSWCQSYYDADGHVIRKMSAEEFDKFSETGSHGICRKCGDELRKQAAQAKRGGNGKNPRGDDREAALRLAEKFHDQTPRAHNRLKVNWPRKAVTYIGPCARIDYVSSKWDGKRARYFHEFKDCEIFAAPNPQPGGGSLLILSGKFKIKPEGLVG